MPKKPTKSLTTQDLRERSLKATVAELEAGNAALRLSFTKLHEEFHEQKGLLEERITDIGKLVSKDGALRGELRTLQDQTTVLKEQRDMWQGAMLATDAVKARAMAVMMYPARRAEDNGT